MTRSDKEKPKKPGYFTKRKKFYKDPFLPIINTESDNRKDEFYAKHFRQLLTLIHQHISPYLNYAHFEFFIPRFNFPLKHEGNHMDISYLTEDGCLCFIQFHVLRPERVPKRVLKEAWQPPNPTQQ